MSLLGEVKLVETKVIAAMDVMPALRCPTCRAPVGLAEAAWMTFDRLLVLIVPNCPHVGYELWSLDVAKLTGDCCATTRNGSRCRRRRSRLCLCGVHASILIGPRPVASERESR